MSDQENLKAKLALEDANRNKKIRALKELDTKRLVDLLPELEEKLEAALREDASFRNLNTGYLSSGTSDCAEVKRLTAELAIKGPPRGIGFGKGQKTPNNTEELIATGTSAKKPTAEEAKNWLILQRTENDELSQALARQNDVAFELENLRISIEMAKKRLENIHKILALRTAQIEFLT